MLRTATPARLQMQRLLPRPSSLQRTWSIHCSAASAVRSCAASSFLHSQSPLQHRQHSPLRALHSRCIFRHEHQHASQADKPTASQQPPQPSSSSSASSSSSSSSSASSPPAADTSLSLSTRALVLWKRLRSLLHHYWLGAKLLWKNVKRARSIGQSAGVPLTYPSHVHLSSLKADLTLGIPFLAVFALPLVGNLAPVFAILVPRYVPKTFWTAEQTLTHVRQDAKASRMVLASLRQIYSFHKHACGLDKFRSLLDLIERGIGRVQVSDLLPLERLVSALSPTPLLLPRAHLLLLHQSLCHAGFLPKYAYTRSMLAKSLARWRERIWIEDQLLLSHGIDQLTLPELVHALYSRGLYRQPIAMGGVLAREQSAQLESVDSPRQKAKLHALSDEEVARIEKQRMDVDHPLLPAEPSPALVQAWRNVLAEWVALHCALQAQTDQAIARATRPGLRAHAAYIAGLSEGSASLPEAPVAPKGAERSTAAAVAEASSAAAEPSVADSPSAAAATVESVTVPAATVAPIPAPMSTVTAASTPLPHQLPSFPLVFLLHAGPLARVPSTAADLAAVQPPPQADT